MIKMSEYAKRRKMLMQKIGPDGIVILPAAPEVFRNGDTHYPYRQNSDFYYLSGFSESEAVLVLRPKNPSGEYILFNRVRNLDEEIWNGPLAGQKGACADFLADQAFPIHEFEQMLPTLLVERKAIHYPLGRYKEFDAIIMRAVNKLRAKSRGGIRSPITFVDVTPSIHEMRLIKSPTEIALMQTAADISASAHIRAMEICKPGINERELDAVLSFEFKRLGAASPAYPNIVASGKNTCVLHYIDNNKKISHGELVLIDAGAEYQNYASDVTRTFPANGRFTAEQRAIYDIVLEAQLAAIKAVKPEKSFMAPHDVTEKIITQGLVDLGILKGNVSDLLAKKAFFPFYMHRTSHWLGLDVHDVGNYKMGNEWRKLKPGMVLTIEPGIYISSTARGVHKRWHNIGVRIEDDVLVTKTSSTVLSQKIPKTIAEVEAVMSL